MDAPLDWLALDVALLDDKHQVVAEMDSDIAYYHGYEGGESWSEGTRDNDRLLPGTAGGELQADPQGLGRLGHAEGRRGASR